MELIQTSQWRDETWVNAGHCVNKEWTKGTTEATLPRKNRMFDLYHVEQQTDS